MSPFIGVLEQLKLIYGAKKSEQWLTLVWVGSGIDWKGHKELSGVMVVFSIFTVVWVRQVYV